MKTSLYKLIKFKYSPIYENLGDCTRIENRFNYWCRKIGVEYHAKSDIFLDGGNVVDNTAGTRVVVTDRILWDNPELTKKYTKNALKELLGVKEVAIIPEPPGDTTGH